ncbi:anthranilate synthase component II [Halovenus sp. HT40]|uniref:anthranilate synthase component II n=1 Tax=Halovenus sp. HT40 TaxID=3126691 RepID=UPI00300F2816
MTRVLVVDNYDSFAYNLVQYVGTVVSAEAEGIDSTDGEVIVRRNDEITLAEVDELDPDAIVVSPGPGTPQEAGISIPLFAERSYPTLGVCLGHQALCAAHGIPVRHADSVVHGKPSVISHDGTGIFAGLPGQFEVGRYHSLAVERGELSEELVETARTDDERTVVMGVRHEERPHVGVQFHPESILTDEGIKIVENFLDSATEVRDE